MSLRKQQLEFFRWLNIASIERYDRGLPVTLDAFSKHIEVSLKTLHNWKRKAKKGGMSLEPAKPSLATLTPKSKEEEADALFLQELTRDVTAPHAKTSDRLLYATIRKMIPKTSIDLKVGLSADEISRRNQEATKQLEAGGFQ